jgi:hypothetical protein
LHAACAVANVKHRFLFAAWLLFFALSSLCAAIFVQGLWRDNRVGEPVLQIDFGTKADWISVPFRVWGAGSYTLFVSTVNHDLQRVGAPLNAEFEVAIEAPAGRFFGQLYSSGSTAHVIANNFGITQLASLKIDDSPLRTWTLKARVLRPDPAYRGVRTDIKIWKERYDPGMGGLVNYVMAIPAAIFLLVALGLAAALARKGSPAPIWITSITAAVFLVFAGV